MAKKPDTFYYDNYRACADIALQAARLLARNMRSFDAERLQGELDEMHAIEQKADEYRHQLIDALSCAFITPLEREDMEMLSNDIDAVIDHLEGVLHRLYFNNVRSMRPDAIEMIDIIIRGCEKLQNLMEELPNFKKSDRLKTCIIELNSIEEEADMHFIRCMRTLHTECNDPLQVIAWRDVYTFLEYCADSCEAVADVVASIVLKNS